MYRFLSSALARGMIVAASGWLLSACSGADLAPTGPSVRDDAVASATQNGASAATAPLAGASTGTLTTVRTLGRLIPLPRAVSGSARIGKAGGTIFVPAAGLRLVVPPGAVDSVVTFVVTALPGQSIAYEFAPHGITFKVPLQLQQSLGKSTWLPGLPLRGGYFKSARQVDANARQAQVDELLPAFRSGGDAVLEIRHFSGYLIAMG